MSETRTTAPVFPPGRYGRRRSGRRRSVLPLLVLVAVLAVSLVVSLKLYQRFGQTDYDAQIVGWSEPTDKEMVIQFRVRVPAGQSASCTLRARDYDGFEVGRRTVVVTPPKGETDVEVKETVTTTKRGSVGDVLGCSPAA
ncbi:hypothetical protein Ade02nite_72270 [Paractinoplanes deccanensis]|uniref:DUF4307 domain-containing protein n=1 Tax=Paractinoplanes deccanensis TaxID=113561 RepID=A0ABQ3YF09_9ACTN|nr:DUF4307 domain-containing protein [Actinoplanes deccanensis]GID78586.1 hypothetical protein Ade02nite_72270 [Actinoplanes deccanensis]